MKLLGHIIKSKSDSQIYKAFKLGNQLTCLVISDKDAQKSAAALSVNVGALQDPVQAQGLAHYLEHMLFMGTEKYPKQSDYQEFISTNSGSTNAYTDTDSTNYFFDIVNGKFPDALDRFAQFFICPLMDPSSSQRQLNAVHSQHSKNLLSDIRKKYQLSKILSTDGHPYQKFPTGDKTTLGKNPNLREMLMDFYNSHYSANLMNLVVYSKEQPEAMMKLIEKLFKDVKDKGYDRCTMKEIPYTKNKALGKIIKMVPEKDVKSLEVWWILKDKTELYKSDPGTYYSHLIGHEGTGSLLHDLIQNGLATELSAGATNSYSCFTKFAVKISLTELGINNIHTILNKLYGYLLMLKDKGLKQVIFKEIQKTIRMRFDYQDKKFGSSYCVSLANQLHSVPKLQEVLVWHYLMEKYDPAVLKDYLEEILDLNNMMVFAVGKKFQPECTHLQEIYKTKYTVQPLPELTPTPQSFHLPPQNTFLPQKLQVIQPLGSSKTPKKIFSNDQYEIFYKQDHCFSLPKGRVHLMLYYNGVNSAKQLVARVIFSDMFKKNVKDLSYMAEMAEIQTSLNVSTFDIELTVAGFSESLLKYTGEYLRAFKTYEPNRDKESDLRLFETLKEKLIRSYKNFFLSNPYELAGNLRTRTLRQGAQISPVQKLQASQTVTFQDVLAFASKWKQQLYIQSYINGNLLQKDSLIIIQHIKEVFSDSKPLPRQLIGKVHPIAIEPNKLSGVSEPVSNPSQSNSCVIVHFQYDKWDVKSSIYRSLCLAFIKEPTFNYLRTKEQLGYIVGALGQQHRGMLGVSILVQSNIKTSHEIVEYVDRFFTEVLSERIGALTQSEFESMKQSLLSSKLEKDQKLSQQSSRFWDQIITHKYNFQRKEQEIKFLPTISLEEFKEQFLYNFRFLNTMFYKTPCRLEIHLTSEQEELKERNTKAMEKRTANNGNFKAWKDYREFKKSVKLHPDYYSHL